MSSFSLLFFISFFFPFVTLTLNKSICICGSRSLEQDGYCTTLRCRVLDEFLKHSALSCNRKDPNPGMTGLALVENSACSGESF